ncbi:unnamed protein product [Trichobilharzia regenti]|nr:unnamed protein product [Trichobilharzia regenti]
MNSGICIWRNYYSIHIRNILTSNSKYFNNTEIEIVNHHKDVEGDLITKEEKQTKQCADHFKGLLNRPPPATHPEIPPTERIRLPANGKQSFNVSRNTECDQANEHQPRRQQSQKEFPAEALKTNPETVADMLTTLLQKVWKEGKVPTD